MSKVLRIDSTPNPLALKFITDSRLADPPRSYRSPAEAPGIERDALAAAIFSIPGVRSVLISGEWVTVNRAADSDPALLREMVRAAIESAGK